jgi:hypothetical protein
MKLSIKSIFVSLAAMIATTGMLYAANVQFKKSVRTTFTDQGLSAQFCGALTGLGNGDVTITLVAAGQTTVMCINPAGNIAPGHGEEIVAMGQTSIPSTEIKNGNVNFCVTTVTPEDPSAKEAGCPNNNWTAHITDVDFSSATVIVEQGGKIVLQTAINP